MGLMVEIPLRPLLTPTDVARMLDVLERELPSIMPRACRFTPQLVRYVPDDVEAVWYRFRPGEDFDAAYERVIASRKPQEPEQPFRQKGRYKLPCSPITGRVYFIEGGEMIKIGYAKKPLKRLETLRTGSAFELKLLASMRGSVSLERHLHERFADLRFRGEWFRTDPKLLRFINEVASWKH